MNEMTLSLSLSLPRKWYSINVFINARLERIPTRMYVHVTTMTDESPIDKEGPMWISVGIIFYFL